MVRIYIRQGNAILFLAGVKSTLTNRLGSFDDAAQTKCSRLSHVLTRVCLPCCLVCRPTIPSRWGYPTVLLQREQKSAVKTYSRQTRLPGVGDLVIECHLKGEADAGKVNKEQATKNWSFELAPVTQLYREGAGLATAPSVRRELWSLLLLLVGVLLLLLVGVQRCQAISWPLHKACP